MLARAHTHVIQQVSKNYKRTVIALLYVSSKTTGNELSYSCARIIEERDVFIECGMYIVG